jgi:hypothetical protein
MLISRVRRFETLISDLFRLPLMVDTLVVELTISTAKPVAYFNRQVIDKAEKKRVGGRSLFGRPTSHTTVRTVRYTAVQ